MRAIRLYSPTVDVGTVVLSPEESRHAAASLRLKPGQAVALFDGVGREGFGAIAEVHRDSTTVNVDRVVTRPFELPWRITLAVAMGRTHRQGYLVEKCTELGVAAIRPIIAERSVSKPDDKAVDRWSRRAIEAAKQSGRVWVPVIHRPESFAGVLGDASRFDVAAVFHTDGARTPWNALLDAQVAGGSVLAVVGPEGGWSQEELARIGESGAVLAALGPTTLRTETAAVAACAAAAVRAIPG